ncbi:response regulator transcription factor [Paenibacillus sp. FSL H8-0034]|uniref:response regulator transcription factor n=1 Tax=Paenibacillus sp. FSL H8-0034 TaxID=2954671 RepID=UPI0030FC1CAB
MKKTVVVIDDKPIIRRAIVQTIKWEELDCEVVGQAEDGIEGLALLEEKRPDIVITDIKMPGHTGLELAQWMREHVPHAKTILITGYQEFEYAKQAIKLGAFDFIVKPIHNQELSRIVRAAADKVEEEQSVLRQSALLNDEVSRLVKRHSHSLPALRGQWLERRINGTEEALEARDAQQAMNELGIEYSRFVLLAFRPLAGNGPRFEKPANREALAELAAECCRKEGMGTITLYQGGDLIVMCQFDRVPIAREVRRKLNTAAVEWLSMAKKTAGAEFRASFGSVYRLSQELEQAYREVSALLDSGFFRSEEMILSAESEQAARTQVKFSVMQDIERFEKSIEQIPMEQLVEETKRIVGQIGIYAEGNITVARGLLAEICLSAARYYFHATGDELGLGKSIDQLLEEVYRLDSLKEASDYMTELVTRIRVKLEGGEKEYSLIVKSIMEHIHEHFAEAVTLTSVSTHFGISSGYLSRLLRTETGENFVDILSRARIKAAKRLLKDPKYKVNEVGEMVGYKEYAYFYQVFKRIEGSSPKEFKNKK